MHPWYTKNAGSGFFSVHIQHHLKDIMVLAPDRGYLLYPNKIILVVSNKNSPWTKVFFQDIGLCVLAGSCYLGGFIGDSITQVEWMEEKFSCWKWAVETLSGVARCPPQAAYSSLHNSLHQGWALMQQISPGVGEELRLVEDALQRNFIPELFLG